MSDLVSRLRESYVSTGANYVQEAADEIERLRAERDGLLDKANRFDLDFAGIEARERDAIELVELRAERDALRAEIARLVVDVNDYMQIANQQLEELAELTAERDALRAAVAAKENSDE